MKIFSLIFDELNTWGEYFIWTESVHSTLEGAVSAGFESGRERFFVQQNTLDGGNDVTTAEYYRDKDEVKIYKSGIKNHPPIS